MNRAEFQRVVDEGNLGAFFRARDLAPLGVSFPALRELIDEGWVAKVATGLYRVVAIEPTELETVAMAVSVIPNGVICLLSALQIHGIGTQIPHVVWVAIDRKARKPSRLPTGVQIVRFSKQMLRYGIATHVILGVPARVTSPARTVVDCFRYRNKIGVDVAAEALRDALGQRLATIDEIVRAAEVCRVRTVIQPYIEGLAA